MNHLLIFNFISILSFIQSKQQDTAAVLVGKAGERIPQLGWAAVMSGFYFGCLRFSLLSLHGFCKCNEFLSFQHCMWIL